MKNTEYVIVGDGYAALFFAHELLKNGRTFLLYSGGLSSASKISAGVVNPVVLKKFTTFDRADLQIERLRKTIHEMSGYLGDGLLIEEPVRRIFHDESEKKLWCKKAASSELEHFLSQDFQQFDNVLNPFGTGEVRSSARLNVAVFFERMTAYLQKNGHLICEKFYYKKLEVESNTYDDSVHYEKIVFAEGMGVKENPFFDSIPVNPNRGHNLQVELSVPFDYKSTFKKKHFLFPLDDGTFYYGGTYDREDLQTEINPAAVSQLNNGLQEIYQLDYSVLKINAGFRPTVKDRRPILGRHDLYGNLFVFNGLGARGVLNGAYYAPVLFDFTDRNIALPQEVDVERFRQ